MNRIERLEESIIKLFGKQDLRSEDVASFLAPGKIEKLVREHRIPTKIGDIRVNKDETRPHYQVPLKTRSGQGKAEDVQKLPGNNFILIMKNRKRVPRGPTFTLTEEQALEVERRIQAEKTHMAANEAK